MTDGSEPEGLRLDALAAKAGVPTTTIRLYQQRGLLPGPRVVGRTGWYGPAHLARLRLIGRLQDEGFSLAGIGKLLQSWEAGRELSDVVGVEQQLDALLHRRTSIVLDGPELAARFPADDLTPEVLGRATALGLVTPTDDGRFEIADRRFIDTGADLVALGVPMGTVLDEWERLVSHTDDIAERFVQVFEDHVLPNDWRRDLDAERMQHLTQALVRLQRNAGQVLLAALDASVARVGARRLAELVPDAGEGP